MPSPCSASSVAEAATGITLPLVSSPLRDVELGTGAFKLSATPFGQLGATSVRDAVCRILTSPLLFAGLVVLSDALALSLANFGACGALWLLGQSAAPHGGVLLVAAVLFILLAALRGSYRCHTLHATPRQLRALLPAAAAAWLLAAFTAAVFGALREENVGWLAGAAPCSLGLLTCGRVALTSTLGGRVSKRAAPRTVILSGGNGTLRLIKCLRDHEGGNLRLLGVFEDDSDVAVALQRAGVICLGTVDEMFRLIRRGEVEQVVLPASWAVGEQAEPILQRLANCPVNVRLATEFVSRHHTAQSHVSFLLLQERPIAGWRAMVKLLADYSLAFAALVVLVVPMLLIAFAIRLESPGPILFRQRRTGFNNQSFLILKFRTMYQEVADLDVQRQVTANDARVTRIGALLRRTSLDELPQLLNILAGEMSFVGPRPHAPGTRAGSRRFEEIAIRYEARHRVKPGLTGLAQVRGWRGSTETEGKLVQRLDCDLEYIKNWSLWLDIVIMIRTLVAVVRMRNAH